MQKYFHPIFIFYRSCQNENVEKVHTLHYWLNMGNKWYISNFRFKSYFKTFENRWLKQRWGNQFPEGEVGQSSLRRQARLLPSLTVIWAEGEALLQRLYRGGVVRPRRVVGVGGVAVETRPHRFSLLGATEVCSGHGGVFLVAEGGESLFPL